MKPTTSIFHSFDVISLFSFVWFAGKPRYMKGGLTLRAKKVLRLCTKKHRVTTRGALVVLVPTTVAKAQEYFRLQKPHNCS